jgi:hypothetical protein
MATVNLNGSSSKPTWTEVELPHGSNGKKTELEVLADKYRAANKVAGDARKALEDEIRERLEHLHRNYLEENTDEAIVLSFRFGKISYAILPREKKTVKRNAVKLSA